MGRTAAQAGRMARRKGLKFQNQVAGMLQEAWGVPVLWTPMSGGLSLRGDLVIGGNPPEHVMAYNIECKHRQDVTLKSVILNSDRLPVTEKQVVFFKDNGVIWLAFDVIKGPGISPPQQALKSPPTYIRIKGPGDESRTIGMVEVTGQRGMLYLSRIKKIMIRKIDMRPGPCFGRPVLLDEDDDEISLAVDARPSSPSAE